MNKERLKEKLMDYFSINNNVDCYHLTRDKSAFEYGTMTFDDFVEFDEKSIDDIIEYVFKDKQIAQIFVKYGGRSAGKTKEMIEELQPNAEVHIHNVFTKKDKKLIVEALNCFHSALSSEMFYEKKYSLENKIHLIERLLGEIEDAI